jgi:hypothetical protein
VRSMAPLYNNPSYYNQSGHADFPSTADPLPYDTHVAMFSPAGQQIYSTPFGGLSSDYPGGVVATNGRLYISGSTRADANFPLHCPDLPGFTPYCHGPSVMVNELDGFIAQLQYNLSIGQYESQGMDIGGLMVYPNPCTDFIKLQIEGWGAREQVTIYNALGEVVLQQKVDGSGPIGLRVSHLSAGAYALTINTASGIRVTRFVKE